MFGRRFWLTDKEFIEVSSSTDESSVIITLGMDTGDAGTETVVNCSKKNAERALSELSVCMDELEQLPE